MKVRLQQLGKRGCLALALVVPFAGGCGNFVDTVSSQRFKKAPFHTTFHGDDPPMEVLRHSEVGDERGRAMLALKEPTLHGGTDAEQDEVMQILSASATTDLRAICRLRAVETLGRFEDPRCTTILLAAYRNAAREAPVAPLSSEGGIVQASRRSRLPPGPISNFTPDTVITLQMRILESLGKKRTPEGLALLSEVAQTPAKREVKSEMDALMPANLGQDQFDLRLAAVRSLENFEGDATVAQFLYRIMTTERDVALKSRAHQSLKKVTGQSYAAKSAEWRTYLKIGDAPAPTPVDNSMPPNANSTTQPLLPGSNINNPAVPRAGNVADPAILPGLVVPPR